MPRTANVQTHFPGLDLSLLTGGFCTRRGGGVSPLPLSVAEALVARQETPMPLNPATSRRSPPTVLAAPFCGPHTPPGGRGDAWAAAVALLVLLRLAAALGLMPPLPGARTRMAAMVPPSLDLPAAVAFPPSRGALLAAALAVLAMLTAECADACGMLSGSRRAAGTPPSNSSGRGSLPWLPLAALAATVLSPPSGPSDSCGEASCP